jgi:integrase/recombinase XerD
VSRISQKKIINHNNNLLANHHQSVNNNEIIERKIVLATEGLATKFCESRLKDRTKLSEENALTISEYIIVMKRETNPRLTYIRYTIQFLTDLSRCVGIRKPFKDMTKEDILYYLDKCRKPENNDPLHKWIGSYNIKRIILIRFFKWLYYPLCNPQKRNELSTKERRPECIMDIPQLKRKEISCYKRSDLWTQEDDLLFLKWVTNRRDRCYHTMARDLSARPHEILALKLKDLAFENVDGYQYAEVLVNGKTGSRPIPLIQSIPYVKDWILNHPSRNNSNSPIFIGLGRRSMGTTLTISGLYQIYKRYKEEFFPKLLKDPTVSIEDKQKIKELLTKPFNPYIRRHSAITEKSTKLKLHTLNQHCGWSMRSNMAQKYIHYFGNESSENLLEIYGVITKDKKNSIDTLSPKICPNEHCREPNAYDAKFCSKCKMIMSFEGYQEALQSHREKEDRLSIIEDQMKTLLTALGNIKDQNQVNQMAKTLYDSKILNIALAANKENEKQQ